jgi:hypothetical protein
LLACCVEMDDVSDNYEPLLEDWLSANEFSLFVQNTHTDNTHSKLKCLNGMKNAVSIGMGDEMNNCEVGSFQREQEFLQG